MMQYLIVDNDMMASHENTYQNTITEFCHLKQLSWSFQHK